MRRPLLILGATGAIGRGVVRAAVEAGWPVVAVARDEASLAGLQREHPGANLQLVVASVADDEGAAALVRAVRALDRPLEGVVAALCKGSERGRLLDQPVARLRDTLDGILLPHLAAARHLLPLLAEAGRSGGYVLVDGPGGEHPWAGYSHRSVGAAALRMLARVLHDEARALPVRVQLLSVDTPVRTETNLAQACMQWPSAIAVGRRALAMIERRDSDGASPLVRCNGPCPEFDAPAAAGRTTADTATSVAPAPKPDGAKPDSEDSLLTSRCLQDVRTLLDSLKFPGLSIPTKGDSPR